MFTFINYNPDNNNNNNRYENNQNNFNNDNDGIICGKKKNMIQLKQMKN